MLNSSSIRRTASRRSGDITAGCLPCDFRRAAVVSDSVVYTDSFNVYDVLDVSEFHHHRINHKVDFVCNKTNHINGIENFWNHAKRTLSRYNGIPRKNFALFLKEAEFRFNYGTPADQLRQIKRWSRQVR